MTPEEHRMLVETRDLAIENAKAIRSLKRSHTATVVFRVIYWAVVIGTAFGAYYFIQPYVNMLKDSVGSVGGIGSISPKAMSFEGAVENIKALKEIYSQ